MAKIPSSAEGAGTMGQRATATCEGRLEAYIDGLASVIGHADRVQPLHDYCVGLMLPLERKSVEPMAAKTAPARTSAKHQSLLHFVGQGQWSDEKLLAKVRELVLPGIERHGAIRAWIFDDTSFPKQGRHSVGVARQYSGQLGKQDIARLWCRCRWPTTTRVCRWRIASTCLRSGSATLRVGPKPACPRTSASRPSRRSRSI
jgi:SRSO17 transposase